MVEVSKLTAITGVGLIGALGDTASALSALGASLQKRPNVVAVLARCDIMGGLNPTVEWYVDAEFADGHALSHRLMLYWRDGEWRIEADISRIGPAGQDVELALEQVKASDETLASDLTGAAASLIGKSLPG